MNDSSLSKAGSIPAADRAALAAAYDQYHLPIYRYIYRQVGEVETARDLAAETFRHLLTTAKQGNGPRDNPFRRKAKMTVSQPDLTTELTRRDFLKLAWLKISPHSVQCKITLYNEPYYYIIGSTVYRSAHTRRRFNASVV